MDEVKKNNKHHWHILTKYKMTYKDHCHTTDTYLQIFYGSPCVCKHLD